MRFPSKRISDVVIVLHQKMSAPVPTVATPEQQARIDDLVKQLKERADQAAILQVLGGDKDTAQSQRIREGFQVGLLFGKLIKTLPIPDRVPVLGACLSKGITAVVNEWMNQVEQGRLAKCNAEEVATFTERAKRLVEAMSKPIAPHVVESNNNEYTDPDA